MSRDNALVSIIIPVYNGENFLQEAIQSALNQTYPNKEVLVINDGSYDNTKLIAESFGSRIRYIEKENGGVASALNVGIQEMRGEYFSWLSHDDLYAPNKISRQMEYFKDHNYPADTIVYCNYKIINALSQEEIHRSSLRERQPQEMAIYFAAGNDMHGCSLLIPHQAFKKAGDFDLSLAHTQDLDMWSRMAKFCKFKLLEDTLVISRSHPQQLSRSSRWGRTFENDAVSIKLLKNALKDMRDQKIARDEWKGLTQQFWRRKLPRSASYAFLRWMMAKP